MNGSSEAANAILYDNSKRDRSGITSLVCKNATQGPMWECMANKDEHFGWRDQVLDLATKALPLLSCTLSASSLSTDFSTSSFEASSVFNLRILVIGDVKAASFTDTHVGCPKDFSKASAQPSTIFILEDCGSAACAEVLWATTVVQSSPKLPATR